MKQHHSTWLAGPEGLVEALRSGPAFRGSAIGLLLALLLGTEAFAQGYAARPCSFDLNDNGVLGEPADCRVCDAELIGGLVQGGTADPDGDGVDEDLIYVDCEAGVDEALCGLEGNPPCRTIEQAWNVIADGPGDGAEDIVCFTGVCSTANSSAVDSVLLTDSGVTDLNSGFYTRSRTGNQVRDFQYPNNPTMLVGWDLDGDGEYPPFDIDDTSLIDTPDVNRGFEQNIPSHSEWAHFSWDNHGKNDDGVQATFLWKLNTSSTRSHIYLHDIESDGVNEGDSLSGTEIAINNFAAQGMTYLAIENTKFTNIGGYWIRGGNGISGQALAGPYRFQNNTVTFMGCPPGPSPCDEIHLAAIDVAKLWGYLDGQEWLDNHFDAQPHLWGANLSAQSIGGSVSQCIQDYVARNNRYVDFGVGITINAYAPSFCDTRADARPVTGVVIDRNEFVRSYDVNPPLQGYVGVRVSAGGPLVENSVHGVTITDNVFTDDSAGSRACIFVEGGNDEMPQPGTVFIVGNRCTTSRSSGGIFHFDDRNNFNHENWMVYDNDLKQGANGFNVRVEYAPENWNADFNCFDPSLDWHWNGGTEATIAGWQNATGADLNSTTDPAIQCPEPGLAVLQIGALTTLAGLAGARRRRAS